MHPSPYHDLIEDKIREWRIKLDNIEERTLKGKSAAAREQFGKMTDRLNADVNTAILQLRKLEKKEETGDAATMKDRILEIFDSVDKNIRSYDVKTPFML